MRKKRKKPSPGEMVVLTELPPRFLDDLPTEDQVTLSGMVGKAIMLKGYDKDGRAELTFVEKNGTIHYVYVNPAFVDSTE
jgi:hypothetical protein